MNTTNKSKLVLVHGGLSNAQTMQPLADALADDFDCLTFDLNGYGARPKREGAFNFPGFAKDVLDVMDDNGIEAGDIFGYSLGGMIGGYLAIHHPDRVACLCTLATRWIYDPQIASDEIAPLDPSTIEQKLPAMVTALKQRQTARPWKEVLEDVVALTVDMGTNPPILTTQMQGVKIPVRLVHGDADTNVPPELSMAAFRTFPQASLSVLSGFGHGQAEFPPARLADVCRDVFG